MSNLAAKRTVSENTFCQDGSNVPSIAQTLVFDILPGIFSLALPCDGFPLLGFDEAPLNVSSVCRHWRGAASSMASLWKDLHIKSAGSESDIQNVLVAFSLWLRMCDDLPLRLKIQTTKLTPCEDSPFAYATSHASWDPTEDLLLEITKFSGRIKDLILIMPDIYSKRIIELIQTSTFPTKSLSLQFYSPRNGKNPFKPSINTTFSTSFGRMEYLRIDGSQAFYLNCRSLPNFSRLVKLEFALSIEPLLLRTLLNCCSHLEEVKLRLTNSWFIPSQSPEPDDSTLPFKFSSIRRFEITTSGYDIFLAGDILDSMEFPGLTEFTLKFHSDILDMPSIDYVWPLPRVLSKFTPCLQTLSLSSVPLTVDSLTRCLTSAPDLRYLHVTLSIPISISKLLSMRIKSCEVTDYLCPQLETISFGIPSLPLPSHRQFHANLQYLWNEAKVIIHSRWVSPGMQVQRSEVSATGSSSRGIRRVILPPVFAHAEYLETISDCLQEGLLVEIEGQPLLGISPA